MPQLLRRFQRKQSPLPFFLTYTNIVHIVANVHKLLNALHPLQCNRPPHVLRERYFEVTPHDYCVEDTLDGTAYGAKGGGGGGVGGGEEVGGFEKLGFL